MFETDVFLKVLEMTICVAMWKRERLYAMWKREKVNSKLLMGEALSYNVVKDSRFC